VRTCSIIVLTNRIILLTHSIIVLPKSIIGLTHSIIGLTNSTTGLTNSIVALTDSIIVLTDSGIVPTNSMILLTNRGGGLVALGTSICLGNRRKQIDWSHFYISSSNSLFAISFSIRKGLIKEGDLVALGDGQAVVLPILQHLHTTPVLAMQKQPVILLTMVMDFA